MKTKVLGLIAVALLAGPAHATIIVTIQQVGSNVVMSGSGTANLAGLGTPGLETLGAFATPQAGWFLVGPVTAGSLHVYSSTAAPFFGSGGVGIPTSGTGDQFGIIGNPSHLAVPINYVSGAQLTGTSIFANQTLAGLGMIPGSYVTNWGSGDNADSLILRIGTTSVPEPATLALLGLGLSGLALMRRRKLN